MSDTTITLPVECSRCHRVLKDAKSIKRGRGPVCERKYQDAVIAAQEIASEEQTRKALALLDGGHVARNKADSFYTVFAATSTYRTDRTSCTCHAGVNGRACYHALAVCLVELGAVKLPRR